MHLKVQLSVPILIAFILNLVSCASPYPTPIVEPTPLKDGVRRKSAENLGGLLPPTTRDEALDNMKIYGDSYLLFADKLKRNKYIADDITLGGGVLGVIGGVTESAATAITGAVAAAGSSITSEHYQFAVQAANYEKASDAMYCMYTKAFPIKDAIDIQHANLQIDLIRHKLRKAQSSVQLISPDLSVLEQAIKSKIDTGKKVDPAIADAKKAGNFVLSNLSTSLMADIAADLKADLEKCVASF